MQYLKTFWRWLKWKFTRKKYFIGIDYATGVDKSCTIYGYKDKDGILHITKVEYGGLP